MRCSSKVLKLVRIARLAAYSTLTLSESCLVKKLLHLRRRLALLLSMSFQGHHATVHKFAMTVRLLCAGSQESDLPFLSPLCRLRRLEASKDSSFHVAHSMRECFSWKPKAGHPGILISILFIRRHDRYLWAIPALAA